jgi:hypothetical protein
VGREAQVPENGGEESGIEPFQERFARIEQEVRTGNTDLSALGFWKLVRAVKADPALATHWADAVGRIDRLAFEARVRPRFPVWLGNAALSLGALAGVGAVVFSSLCHDRLWSGLALVASAGIWSVTLHDLGHWVAGRMEGIRFTCYFLDGPFRIQPGLKTDYATYLRTSPEGRATMHAAGALASKIAPFVSLALWPVTNAPGWAALAIAAIGVIQIVTDVVWSTKHSDWKKVARERRVAASQRAAKI